jgi:hypothetical protein
MKLRRLLTVSVVMAAGGCAYQQSNSLLMGNGGQRIELTGYSFDTSEQGDAKVATFAGHRASFEPERIVIDGQTVFAGPYRRAAVNRGKAGAVLLTVDGRSVPVAPAQTGM